MTVKAVVARWWLVVPTATIIWAPGVALAGTVTCAVRLPEGVRRGGAEQRLAVSRVYERYPDVLKGGVS